MIKILTKEESLHIGTCNSCGDFKADIEVKFKSRYNCGGLVVALCNKCIKELQACLSAIEPPKEEGT